MNYSWCFHDKQITNQQITLRIVFIFKTYFPKVRHIFQSHPYLLHIFQDPCFPGSKFFWAHVFKGPGWSGSGSRIQLQVLEVSLWIYMEIILWHRCSPVNLLFNSEHLFIRSPLKDCFCIFKLWFLCFCITSHVLLIMWAFIFFN